MNELEILVERKKIVFCKEITQNQIIFHKIKQL